MTIVPCYLSFFSPRTTQRSGQRARSVPPVLWKCLRGHMIYIFFSLASAYYISATTEMFHLCRMCTNPFSWTSHDRMDRMWPLEGQGLESMWKTFENGRQTFGAGSYASRSSWIEGTFRSWSVFKTVRKRVSTTVSLKKSDIFESNCWGHVRVV